MEKDGHSASWLPNYKFADWMSVDLHLQKSNAGLCLFQIIGFCILLKLSGFL